MRTMTALLLAASAAFAGDTAADAKRKLETRISLDLRNTPLSEAVEVFRSVTGLNFVVAEGGETVVSMKLLDVSARSALRLLLQSQSPDLKATIEDGVVVIRRRQCSRDAFSTRIYDVRGATARLQEFPGIDVGAGETSCCFLIMPDEPRPAVLDEDFLVSLIRAHTGDLQTWTRSEGSVTVRNGLLVVRQTAEVHREIRTLLQKLGL